MRKEIPILVFSAVLAMAGCSSAAAASSSADSSAQTVTGKVTAIDGSTVTLQIGSLNEGPGNQKPEDNPGGAAPSAKPDGSSGERPAQDDKAAESDNSEEDNHNSEDSTSSATSSANPGGGFGERPDGANENRQGGGMFTAGEDTAVYELSDAAISNAETSETKSISDIEIGDVIVLTVDENSKVTSVMIMDMDDKAGFGGSGEITQGTSANTISEDSSISSQSYVSGKDDENALRIDGAKAVLDGIEVNKAGGASSDTESGDFYGMNAALLATDGASVTAKNIKVTSDAQNGNGVFSYGEGTVVNISDSTISTMKDNSGGIQTTGGGTPNAVHLTVSTQGNSSAAIRSDRGGGTVNVSQGTYTSNGYNSPGIYSTAAITASDAAITATKSQALVIEGANSIDLTDCTVSGSMDSAQSASADIGINNVMIYQSMSGDAEVGSASFSMTGGSLTGNAGDMFFVTNTHAVMNLDGVKILNQDSAGRLLVVTGNSAAHGWGTAGANGGQLDAVWSNETLNGDIEVDSISTLNLELDHTVLNGSINIIDNEEGGTAKENNAVITIDSGSVWNLTGSCRVSSLFNNGTINYNGYSITLEDGTVLTDKN